MALLARQRTGEGQRVTTDLLSGAFHSSTWDGTAELNSARISSHGNIGAAEKALRRTYRTADGCIELSPTFSETGLSDLSAAMGLGDLSADPRFSTNEAVLENRAALNEVVGARFLEQTTEVWILHWSRSIGTIKGLFRPFSPVGDFWDQVIANKVHRVVDVVSTVWRGRLENGSCILLRAAWEITLFH